MIGDAPTDFLSCPAAYAGLLPEIRAMARQDAAEWECIEEL